MGQILLKSGDPDTNSGGRWPNDPLIEGNLEMEESLWHVLRFSSFFVFKMLGHHVCVLI